MSLTPLRRLAIPFLLLVSAIISRLYVGELPPVYRQFLVWMPYITLLTAIVLCVYFSRARLFTASLVLFVAYYLIRTELQVALTEPRALIIYSMISLAIPFNFIVLTFIPETGLRNRYGIIVAAMVPVQCLLGWWLLNYYPQEEILLLIEQWLPVKTASVYVLSTAALLCFLVSIVAGSYRTYTRDTEPLAALFSVLVISFITLAFFNLSHISITMIGAAGIVLIISLVRSSYEMAYVDELTGLPGRRALNERLRSLGGRYVLAMTDVDHFKKFNDTYGHDLGDEVLKMVAKQLAAVRGGGTAYRYGGEEFCIVFSGRDIDYCEPYLEEVRGNVENYRMKVRDSKQRPKSEKTAQERRGRRSKGRGEKSVAVTVSIGMAARTKDIKQPEAVLKAADKALYRAKKAGRNRLAK